MPRPVRKTTRKKATTTTTATRRSSRKVVTKVKKSAIDKLEATISKWDAATPWPDHVKLGTSDFLDLLASKLEKGESVSYTSPLGNLSIVPRRPKELLNTVKYLRKQSTLGSVKKKKD